MPMFVSSCQHYDEQQFSYTLICTVVKLDVFIQALLLDHNLVLEKNTCTTRVRLVISVTTLQYRIACN